MRTTTIQLLAVILSLVSGGLSEVRGAPVDIDPGTRYQTILGYGASAWTAPQLTAELRNEIAVEAVWELGLNRLRMEGIPAGNTAGWRRWEWENDDGDPEHLNWAAFNTPTFDTRIAEFVAEFKAQVEARGEVFDSYVSPSFFDGGSSGSPPVWLLRSPGEYAEYAMSLLLYLRDTHGIEPTYYCILNEAGNNNPFSWSVVSTMVKTLAPRMEAAGFFTTIEFPDSVNTAVAWNYINSTSTDDQMWPWVGVVTYHLYGSKAERSQIRDFAWARGLPTGQTEYMGLTTTHLYDDMTQGGTSYWEIYGIGSQFDWSGANFDTLERKSYYWPFRQLMHYVRPGAVRVAASSGDSQLRVLAFEKDGKSIVVLFNDLDSNLRTADLSGLVPGSYGASVSTNRASFVELGLQIVAASGTLSIDVPGSSVLTLYPYPGQNQPPTFTDFKANPAYRILPQSTATLIAAAQDPELDAISYSWSVLRQPAGANAVLSAPSAASCPVTGLDVAGTYAFEVTASDGASLATREVRINVFASNQPPKLNDVHNRRPVVLTLPQSSTTLRSDAWDLEGDAVTFHWSIESQPSGASAQLLTPDASATDVTGMSVAGDYVFKITASETGNSVFETLTVPVYPVDSPPVISAISATPASITLPASASSLSAVTSDPDGDVISHWWSTKSAPSAIHPVFSSPGSKDTQVSGLIAAGTYTFSLTVVDRDAYATRDVSVSVSPGGAEPLFHLVSPNGGETYRGGQQVWLRWDSSGFSGDLDIELFSQGAWSTVTTQTADDGIELWTVPNIDADDCLIRISASGGNSPTDESDGPFSISMLAAICTNGSTRPCYSGPAGTEGVGECRAGTLTCQSGAWGACTDQVLPKQEDCTDTLDNDCDGLTDAEDLGDCSGGPDGGQDAGQDAWNDGGPEADAGQDAGQDAWNDGGPEADAGQDAGQDARDDEGPGTDADGGDHISGGCSCGSSTGSVAWLWWFAIVALLYIRNLRDPVS